MHTVRLLAAIAALCDLFVPLLTLFAVRSRYLAVNPKTGERNGTRILRYFTTDANLLAAFATLLAFPWALGAALKGSAVALPVWALVLQYAAACAVTLTMLTVLAFLAPTQGFSKMLGGANFCLHLLCPLLCVLPLLLPVYQTPLARWAILPALLPVLIYGAVYLYLAVVKGADRGGWRDFYGFNRGGRWYVALPLMLAAAALVAVGLQALIYLFGGVCSVR